MLSFSSANTFEQGSKGCFWKIELNDKTGYLLGSIHAASFQLLDPEGKIMECFNLSQSLAVETDTTGVHLLNAIREIKLEEIDNQLKGIDPEDKERLAQNTTELLNAIGEKILMKNLCEDKNTINQSILQLYEYLYCDSTLKMYDNGMEPKFQSLAKERNLLIYDLEKLEGAIDRYRENIQNNVREYFQEGIGKILQKRPKLDSSKLESFSQMFDEKVVESSKEFEKKFANEGVFENWKMGNLEYFETYNQTGAPPGFPPVQTDNELSNEHHERMERNEEMAENYLELIKDGKLPFGLVGARHTVGAGFKHRPGQFSMLSYLERKGCKITRIFDSAIN